MVAYWGVTCAPIALAKASHSAGSALVAHTVESLVIDGHCLGAGGCKAKIRVVTGLVPPEAWEGNCSRRRLLPDVCSAPGVPWRVGASPLPVALLGLSLCLCVHIPFFVRTPVVLGQGHPPPVTSCKLNQ